MAYVGFLSLFAALHAATAAVHKFETYADSVCSVLTKTDWLKKAAGSADCYVYTDEAGAVVTDENGAASSFALTCGSGGPGGYVQYAGEDCAPGSAVSGAEPWFTKTMCTSERFHRDGQVLTVYSDYGSPDSSCSKAYLAHW